MRAIDNCSSPLRTDGLDSKDRKHQNLQSSIFGGGYVDDEPIGVDRQAPKIAFATTADWKTQAALARPKNDRERARAYKLRQQELLSQQVNLEQTAYEEHLPETKF